MTSIDQEIFATYVHVNPVLREYIVATNGGSDILFPDYRGELWILVKSMLKTMPADYKPMPPGPQEGFIRIAMPLGRLKPCFNIHVNAVIQNNTLFRSYLDEADQSKIEFFLTKGFKKTFRDFMTGAVICNDDLGIKLAIDKFCEAYHLPMEKMTYEMLRKDWYRYRQRDARGEVCRTIKDEIL